MKKEYVRPELNVVSLVVEDNINNIIDPFGENDDTTLSLSTDLGGLFG